MLPPVPTSVVQPGGGTAEGQVPLEPGEEPTELTGTESAPDITGGYVQSDFNLKSWMSRVPDTVNLKDMSIPGTHETCALRDDTAFGLGHCQARNLEWQLNNGVRFIDIRCYRRDSKPYFEIFHGDIDQNLYFGSVLGACRDFLNRNPSETILMRISQTKSSESAANFRRVFEDVYLTQDGWRPWFYDLGNTSRIPALGEVRKKIVLMSSGPYLDMGFNLGSGLFDTQDNWNGPGIVAKKNAVQQQLYKAASVSSKQKMYMNYTSATGPGISITTWGYAKELNPWTLSKIYEGGAGSRYGVVIMDWVDRHNGSTSGGYTNMMSAIIKYNTLRSYMALTMSGNRVFGEPYAGHAGQSFHKYVTSAPFPIKNSYTDYVLYVNTDNSVSAVPSDLTNRSSFRAFSQSDGSVGLRMASQQNMALRMTENGVVTVAPYAGITWESFRLVDQADGSLGIRGFYF
ncbi:phosphatidylinositol-specific phospholipase C domain-containing protein [Streptomyces sp. NPDC001667]